MPKNREKIVFSDANQQKQISYSCCTPQKYIIGGKKPFLCTFTGPLLKIHLKMV